MDLIKFSEKILELQKMKVPFVCVTITQVKGSAPQNLGAKLIVTDTQDIFGTIGGEKIEAHCIKVAIELLHNTKDSIQRFSWNLQRDIGMTCGGEVSFLFEKINSQSSWNIAIFGAGHVSQALTRLLLNLNCTVTVIDSRIEWIQKLPESTKLNALCLESPKDYLAKLPAHCYLILMTKGHATDVPILADALTKFSFPYLGVIGSKSKRNAMEKELRELEVSESLIKKIICPIGEDFGSNDPSEISFSIIAQLLKTRDILALS